MHGRLLKSFGLHICETKFGVRAFLPLTVFPKAEAVRRKALCALWYYFLVQQFEFVVHVQLLMIYLFYSEAQEHY